MPQGDGTVVIEGARILYRNFKGEKRQYNNPGDRNFCVVLDEDTAAAMAADGWKIRRRKPRDEEDVDRPPFLQVKINFDSWKPPRIVLVTSGGRVNLDEAQVEMLDWADILNVDLIVRPFAWEREQDGTSGITAYLQSMFVVIEEDPLEMKYSEVPQR
jgi:hypothetical protein